MSASTTAHQVRWKLLLSLAFVASHFLWFSYSAQGQAGAKLSGVVYYGNAVMPGFPVSLYSPDQILQTKTDSEGRFEFSGLPQGSYDLEAKFLGVDATIYGIRVENKDVGPLTVTDFPIHCLNQLRATLAALWYERAADALSMVITSLELTRLRGSAARLSI